jgi:hypothetical protein
MGSRSAEQVKQDLESERQRLGDAVQALRSQAGTVRRRLPLIALVVGGSGLVLRTVARRVRSRREQGTDRRGRFPFVDRH